MKVWAIANQKGGVGKTTTAVALGGLLAAWGFRTLVIDIDPHGSLTSYFRLDPDNVEHSSYSLFEAVAERRSLDPFSLVLPTGTEGLSMIPAAVALATLDRQSGRLEGMGLVLQRAVAQLREGFDYILIDCPPVLGVLLINALAACELLIVPVQTEFLAIKGLERLQNTLKMVTKARPTPLRLMVVPTFFDPRTRASHDSLDVLRREHAEHLWDGVIPIDTKFREASRVGLPPAIFDPRGRGVEAYARLLEELVQQPAPAAANGAM
ncbi:MAG: ParA family protein [Chromatiaceae bacterium]|nr:ParA family protein [Chromatiaceae bacterium]MCP5312541.1 ParA family protein [Chromatiaceae bacterium]